MRASTCARYGLDEASRTGLRRCISNSIASTEHLVTKPFSAALRRPATVAPIMLKTVSSSTYAQPSPTASQSDCDVGPAATTYL